MIVVGEMVNATRRHIGEAIKTRDHKVVEEEIRKQDLAGAHYLDLNASTGTGDLDKEIDDMKWLIDIALDSTGKSLAIDTADSKVMRHAAEHIGGRRSWLMNSIKGDAEAMESLLPIAIGHKVPFIALAMDSTGIPRDALQRIAICRNILSEVSKSGIPEENVFFDPILLPISTDITQGKVSLETLSGLKEQFPQSKTTMGLSNISHGLPQRSLINQAFLLTAISYGLDSVICDPTDPGIQRAIALGELISGRDRHCRRFTRKVRKGEV